MLNERAEHIKNKLSESQVIVSSKEFYSATLLYTLLLPLNQIFKQARSTINRASSSLLHLLSNISVDCG